MKIVLAIVLFVLALPVVAALGIALGPAALVILLICAFGAPILLVDWAHLRHGRER